MEIFLILVWIIFALAGIFFSVMPPFPGPLVSWLGMLIFYVFSDAQISETFSWILIISGILAGATLIFDIFASWIGAKKFGASWLGGLGAVAGSLIFPWLFAPLGIPILGLLIGPFLGAFLVEFFRGRRFRESINAGFGAFAAFLVATFVKVVFCVLLAWTPFLAIFAVISK